nr:ABC transporter permease [Pelagibacterales bacterium]
AVIIVGGNIAHQTRVMTTIIVLETSRVELSMSMSLGITLIIISILLTTLLFIIKEK